MRRSDQITFCLQMYLLIPLLFTCCVFIKMVDAQETSVSFEYFSLHEAEMDTQWFWLREDTTGWQFIEGKLHVLTNGSLWNYSNNQKNILLRPLSQNLKENLCTVAKVNGYLQMNERYEHVGIIYYLNDDNWITLTLLNHVQDKAQKLMLVCEEKGRGRDEKSVAVVYTSEAVELRMCLDGSTAKGWYREVGSDKWKFLGKLSFYPDEIKKAYLGLVAGDGEVANQHWVMVDSLGIGELN